MSTRETLIERLNTVLSWELAGTIQYLQGAALVTGPMRPVYADFLQEGSKEARGHAEDVASRIVALGGVPTVEPAAIRTSTSLEGILDNALALEEAALAAWEAALEASDGAALGIGFWIEEMIAEEQEHVDELRKITGRTGVHVNVAGDAGSQSA